MDTNDFLGSVAQEDVSFTTRVVKTKQIGDNFWKALIFVESDRYVDVTSGGWEPVPGTSGINALAVSAADYADKTTGVLRSWLYDLFCNGFNGDCILVACAPHSSGDTVIVYSSDGTNFFTDSAMSVPAVIPAGVTPVPTGEPNQYSYQTGASADNFVEKMEEAYSKIKAYAYHKTVCAAPTLPLDTDAFAVDPTVAAKLAELCSYDKGLLSSAPYFPYSTGTPEDPMSDPLYAVLKNTGKDAFMSAHQDRTRNAALYSLGLAMASLNGSGTCIGNSMDMVASANITSSGPEGTNLDKSVRDSLARINIQTFKPLGDNSGNVVARGASTLDGEVVQATWIIAYITYMTKVTVARAMSTPNFLKNDDNYRLILNLLRNQLLPFGTTGSGRLRQIVFTTPSFENLPPARGDQIIIPDAWHARYVDQVRNIEITGTLYIGEGE